MLERIPIRLRLTLAFAGVMAILLAGAGLLLRGSVAGSLDASVDQSLEARSADVRALVARAARPLPVESSRGALAEAGHSFAQVLDARGRVVDATPPVRAPLLTPPEVAAARRGRLVVERGALPGVEGRARLLAMPVDARGRGLVAVVGASLEGRDDALGDLEVMLAIGGPIALLLASAAGYGVASAAFRPVEAMRRRAARISGGSPGERLPVPPASDEIRRLGETLNDMLERIDRSLARERAFVADASHELRTPLAILKAELELAQRGRRSAGELRSAIASAGEEADRLTRLAEDLLVIARSDRGGLPVRAEPIAAREILDGTRARFAARAAREGRPLRVDDGDQVVVLADRARVEQAMANLVENALSHGAGPVGLSARAVDGTVELHVTDVGPGLSPMFLPDAFERFTRAASARGRGGAGLGLAIVRAVARAHGGEAHAAVRPGGGLDAWVSLPAASPPEPAPDPGPAASHRDLI